MKEFFRVILDEPWPWWVGGPLIGLFVIVLLIVERKQLGISSSYQYICSKVSPWKLEYFKHPEKSAWQFYLILGLIAGGAIICYVNPAYEIGISNETIISLKQIGVSKQEGFVPVELYNFSPTSILFLLIGGLFIGFGARYANGCTAGHAIMGVAQLATSSIISTVCFFIGGLVATYFILPFIF